MVQKEIGEIVGLIVGLVFGVVSFAFVKKNGTIISLSNFSDTFVVVADFISVFFGHHYWRLYKFW